MKKHCRRKDVATVRERRTSLNDIGGKAHEMASAVREQYLTPTQPKDE